MYNKLEGFALLCLL